MGNIDLDDVPRLLDGEFDPFMVIEGQKYQREVARQTRNMQYVRLPKTSRGRGRSAETEKEPGFVAQSILSNPANAYSRPSTGAGLASAVGRYCRYIDSRGGARPEKRDQSALPASQTNYSETSLYTSFTSQPTAVIDSNESMNATAIDIDIETLMRPSSGYLVGSTRVPNMLSYIDSAEAHSPIGTPAHSRPNSRK